jgi:hypothetical protein
MYHRSRWRIAAVAAVVVIGLAGCAKAAASPGDAPSSPPPASATLVQQMSAARAATARYANSLSAAQADGYQIITPFMPGMGYHYMNPKIQGFDINHPQILVYNRQGSEWQLSALEWVFGSMPTTAPLEGATYGTFPAACHYADGTFVAAKSEKDCATTTGNLSPFTFWHPDLITLHLWVWFDNPAGIYHGTNPLVAGYA